MSKLKKKIIIIISIITIVLIIPFIIAFLSPYTVLIKNTSSRFFIAKYLLIAGDHLICLKDNNEYQKRKVALAVSGHDFKFAFLSISDFVYMKIIPEQETKRSYTGRYYATKYLGKYKVDVSGNLGYLYVRSRKKKLFGTFRFPDWANGVFEPLKNLWISKGKIGFIRSVDTPEELKRVGIRTYFTQEFYGEYKRKGNVIEGYYMNRGAKNIWRAYRMN